jgi:hypothetical protein
MSLAKTRQVGLGNGRLKASSERVNRSPFLYRGQFMQVVILNEYFAEDIKKYWFQAGRCCTVETIS